MGYGDRFEDLRWRPGSPPRAPRLLVLRTAATAEDCVVSALAARGYEVEALESGRSLGVLMERQTERPELLLVDADDGGLVDSLTTWARAAGIRALPVFAIPRRPDDSGFDVERTLALVVAHLNGDLDARCDLF